MRRFCSLTCKPRRDQRGTPTHFAISPLSRGRWCHVVQEVGDVLAGAPLIPLDLAQSVSRYFKLPGVAGPLAMVASSIDTAVWDALAVAAQVPLATLLGSRPKTDSPPIIVTVWV